MDIYQKLEAENCNLIERVTQIDAENSHLNLEVEALRKSLEKQKNLYRTFSNEVIESERHRNETFKSEKRLITEENKSLVKENRQLKKDVSFYKKAFEELANSDESAHNKYPNQRAQNVDREKEPAIASEKEPVLAREKEPVLARRSTRKQATHIIHESAASTESKRSPQVTLQAECNHKSSRALSKVNEKLYIENKKQKIKINSLSATVQLLKTKNRQLENYKKKMVNKKLKFSQEVDELDRLVESTQLKNRDKYTAEILARLDELCK